VARFSRHRIASHDAARRTDDLTPFPVSDVCRPLPWGTLAVETRDRKGHTTWSPRTTGRRRVHTSPSPD
jgi:hypothetical protein